MGFAATGFGSTAASRPPSVWTIAKSEAFFDFQDMNAQTETPPTTPANNPPTTFGS